MTKKKDWVDKIFGRTSRKEKVVIKTAVYGVGALALLGAGSKIAQRFKK